LTTEAVMGNHKLSHKQA